MPAMSKERPSVEQVNLHLLAEDDEQYDGESITSELFDRSSTSKRRRLYLIALTIGLSGLQGVFAVQFSYGSPYLLSLGLSKPLMALVWVASPLAGALVQPYVGICSDQSRHRWGRRRPYIAAGGIAAILSLLGLAWVKEIVRVSLHFLAAGPKLMPTTTKILAVVFVYSLNTAIQPIQGGIRALMVEYCPRHQQSEANAWASRLIEIGNIVIYLSAYTPLPRLFPFLNDAQFKILCIIVSLGLVITLSITCLAISERPSRENENITGSKNILERLWSIKNSIGDIPPEINRLCRIQFFSWMGWFPFLYYITTCVFPANAQTFGLFLYISETLGLLWHLHSYISQIYIEQQSHLDKVPSVLKGHGDDTLSDAARVGSLALLLHAAVSLFTGFIVPLIVQQTTAHTLSISTSAFFDRREKGLGFHCLTLKNVWLVSHVLFASCLLGISVVHSLTVAILIVSLMGINRAITTWAPYALLAAELSCGDEEETLTASSNARAGVILGLHNMAISLPQILSALSSSVIFWFMKISQGDGANGGLEWILRLSALPALIAAFLTLKLDGDRAESDYTARRPSRAKERTVVPH